jgi:7-keto-8-aminopelargonate synthetase-like enzyme
VEPRLGAVQRLTKVHLQDRHPQLIWKWILSRPFPQSLFGALLKSKEKNVFRIGDREVINFASFGYLGLEKHPHLGKAISEAFNKYGTSTGASRIFHEPESLIDLQNEIARVVGAEKALVAVNVAVINQGIIPALFSGKESVLYLDKRAHATIQAGAKLAEASGATCTRVEASDLVKLERFFQQTPSTATRKVLLVDGVYSMHGHVLPLKEIQELCRRYNVILYVDDAHGFGIYGEHGGGVVEEFALPYDNLLYVGSLNKGIGANGGFVAGNREIIETLRGIALCFVFSDSVSPLTIASARAALEISVSVEGNRRRKALRLNSIFLREQLSSLGFDVPTGESPVVPVPIGDEEETLRAGLFLLDQGIYVNSVVYPAVSKGSGLLRISLNANHTVTQLAMLVSAIKKLAPTSSSSYFSQTK